MAHWAILDDSAPDFRYTSGWFSSAGTSTFKSPYRSTSHGTNASNSCEFSFEGTAFVVYGAGQYSNQNRPKSDQIECTLDGATVSVDVFVTSPDLSDASQWCGQVNLTSGRHTVRVLAKSATSFPSLHIDYAAILPSPGRVQSNQGVVFDKGDPAITYSSDWNSTGTSQPGASLRFDFNGVGVSMYGSTGYRGTSASPGVSSGSYSVDGGQPQIFTWASITTQKLFQTSVLSSGKHSVEVVYQPKLTPPPIFALNSFIVDLPQKNKPSAALPLIITFSILGALLIIIAAWFLLRKRSRRRTLKSASAESLDEDPEPPRVEPLLTLPTAGHWSTSGDRISRPESGTILQTSTSQKMRLSLPCECENIALNTVDHRTTQNVGADRSVGGQRVRHEDGKDRPPEYSIE